MVTERYSGLVAMVLLQLTVAKAKAAAERTGAQPIPLEWIPMRATLFNR
jgi:hypothetical protein